MLKVFVIALVFAGAMIVLISRQPEQIFARSTDGVVFLSGVSRTVHSATIELFLAFENPFVKPISSYYLITPKPEKASLSSDIIVLVLQQWKLENLDVTEFFVYYYSPKTSSWLEVPTIADLTENTLLASLDISEPTWIVVGKK